jgi:hypothetical protein
MREAELSGGSEKRGTSGAGAAAAWQMGTGALACAWRNAGDQGLPVDKRRDGLTVQIARATHKHAPWSSQLVPCRDGTRVRRRTVWCGCKGVPCRRRRLCWVVEWLRACSSTDARMEPRPSQVLKTKACRDEQGARGVRGVRGLEGLRVRWVVCARRACGRGRCFHGALYIHRLVQSTT